MTERYVVIDQDGWKVNTIVYSPSSPFTVEDGYSIELESESVALPKPLPESVSPVEE